MSLAEKLSGLFGKREPSFIDQTTPKDMTKKGKALLEELARKIPNFRTGTFPEQRLVTLDLIYMPGYRIPDKRTVWTMVRRKTDHEDNPTVELQVIGITENDPIDRNTVIISQEGIQIMEHREENNEPVLKPLEDASLKEQAISRFHEIIRRARLQSSVPVEEQQQFLRTAV